SPTRNEDWVMDPREGCLMVSPARSAWCCFAMLLASFAPARGDEPGGVPDPLAWPEASSKSRPWTRWWWLGSAVDRPTLSRLLEQYQKAGLGGVEICPIYGAKGAED